MAAIDISASGTKPEVKRALREQAGEFAAVLSELIDRMPGSHVSVRGTLSGDPAKKFGNLDLKGSFWTA